MTPAVPATTIFPRTDGLARMIIKKDGETRIGIKKQRRLLARMKRRKL